MGLWRTGQTRRFAKCRTCGRILPSWRLVSYCREERAGEHGLQWSVGSRLIGFEKDRNSLGETQPRTCLVICDSVPVCVVVDRLRPCTPAELLALHHKQTKSSSPLATDAQIQQGFIDERASLTLTTADPSQAADEGENEDERHDGITTRKIFETSQNCKEGSRDVTRCLISLTEGLLRTSQKWIPSNENGRVCKKATRRRC